MWFDDDTETPRVLTYPPLRVKGRTSHTCLMSHLLHLWQIGLHGSCYLLPSHRPRGPASAQEEDRDGAPSNPRKLSVVV